MMTDKEYEDRRRRSQTSGFVVDDGERRRRIFEYGYRLKHACSGCTPTMSTLNVCALILKTIFLCLVFLIADGLGYADDG